MLATPLVDHITKCECDDVIATTATAAFAPMTRMFKALGDDVRLRIVALLSHGELCVCHVQTALGLTQPNASRHLGILRAAGLVTYERRDKWAYYRLAPQSDAGCKRQLDRLVATFADQAALRKDIARLRRSIGPGACKQ